jgi:hypothetical protein
MTMAPEIGSDALKHVRNLTADSPAEDFPQLISASPEANKQAYLHLRGYLDRAEMYADITDGELVFHIFSLSQMEDGSLADLISAEIPAERVFDNIDLDGTIGCADLLLIADKLEAYAARARKLARAEPRHDA